MKLTKEQFNELFWDNAIDGFTVVEEGDWINDGKYDHKEIIIGKDGKFWAIYDSRTGSYSTEYCYGSEYGEDHLEAVEVEKVEVMKYEWKAVKHEA